MPKAKADKRQKITLTFTPVQMKSLRDEADEQMISVAALVRRRLFMKEEEAADGEVSE